MTALAILCGMEAEAAALGRWRADPRVSVAIAAGRPDRAEAEAARLAAAGARALLSWGIAGGLDPALASGGIVVPDGVVMPGGRPVAFDPALVAVCRAAAPALPPSAIASAPPERPGPASAAPGLAGAVLIAGTEDVLFAPSAKAALRRRTGAAAVDMESHRVAAAARRSRLPCVAIRAVSDSAGRRLPALVAHALDAAGRPRRGTVLAGLARRPWDLPALLAAGRDSGAALQTLRAAADALVPALLSAIEDPPAR